MGLKLERTITASDAWEFYSCFLKLTEEEKIQIYGAASDIKDIIKVYTLNGAMRKYYSWYAWREKNIKSGTIVEIIGTEDTGIVLEFEGKYMIVYGLFGRGSLYLFELDEVKNISPEINYSVDFNRIFGHFS